MVFHRRLEYGFNGYRVPVMPRAARSPRRRGRSIKKKGEDYNMCAFDLLAAVAGKLLVGKDTSSSSSPSSSNSSTKHDQCTMTGNSNSNSSLKQESFDQGSCVRGSADSHNTCCFKEITDPVNKNVTGFTEVNVTPDGPPSGLDSDKLMKDEAVEDESLKMKNVVDMYSLGKNPPVVWDAKPLAQIKISESAVKETEEHVLHGGAVSPKIRDNNVVLVDNSRDDDESSSGCTHRSSTATKSFRSALRFGDRRIRKVLASKYWKVAKKWKHNLNFPKHEADLKTDEKQSYKHLRSERIFPFKKRNFFDLNTESNSDGEVTGDGSVKLRIGSFKVPELFIEIPETATIGSLKRAVMEAVTTALGGELRVGVLLQGNKVGDDSKTLLQTGICHDEETDVLGFTLEPSSSPSGPPMSAPPLLHCSASQSLFRSEGREGNFSTVNEAHGTNLGNSIESDRVSVTSPTDASNRATTMVSKAIVPVSSALKREAALAAVPIRRKPKQSEMAQRRIRRPFSVAEVEALVQAIEKLGTGRWRDVKLRAFDSAKHRTYVDLKDKWKTLVHTARISPQQRRGEPVPQELLDRVLTAHAYWSQHQAKQHVT